MADVTLQPITRLLIANRGEIARRVMRTAREMGIYTIAIYADSDADAPFVHEADEAIALHGQTSKETYLDVAKVMDACKRSRADAVHPGYGFLSENTDFARAIEAAGVIWVGPSPNAIAQMGDKLSAKRLMIEAGVPTLPAQELTQGQDVQAAARDVGYPVLVKASAGGGGRGMRVVEREADLVDAIASARREAGASFGDDTLFLERWLAAARHVEIQILGDNHGNLVHCFERECSIQRRHQKVIEEAPSPAVTPAIREAMGAAAVAAAKQIGYRSAGTVEFLLDGADFWFLEVNTRLQVEHPITEEITGLDLVREQLRLAEGELLGYSQDDLAINGHAIEARVYAEDPANDFLPAPGTVAVWAESTSGSARYDTGVTSGSEVSQEFDPMIAKVIVHAPSRREAAARLARVLETTRIQGLTHNRDFLVACLRAPEFLAGDTTTDFIERVQPQPRRTISVEERDSALLAVAMVAQHGHRSNARVLGTIPSGFRNSNMPPQRMQFRFGAASDSEDLLLCYRRERDGAFVAGIGLLENGDAALLLRVVVHGVTQSSVELAIDGRRQTFQVTQQADQWLVHSPQGDLQFESLPRFAVKGAGDLAGGLVAPMPGKVLEVNVAVGDAVEQGQVLLILEAMKMEHRITAPMAGIASAVHVAAGQQADNGQLLIELTGELTGELTDGENAA